MKNMNDGVDSFLQNFTFFLLQVFFILKFENQLVTNDVGLSIMHRERSNKKSDSPMQIKLPDNQTKELKKKQKKT